MAEPKFDKEGNLSNLDELTTEEVAGAYQEKNKSIFGRLTEEEKLRKQAEADKAKLEKDLEEERKKNAQPPKDPVPQTPPQPDVSTDELRLIARGLSDEEIDEAKSIAKGKGISLTEALKTTSFKLFQDNLKEEKRKEEAKLGPAKGSGQEGDSDFKPGMSPDEHKEQWKKRLGK